MTIEYLIGQRRQTIHVVEQNYDMHSENVKKEGNYINLLHE